MYYEGDIYRPPSEAWSLIVQATVGCSHNGCAFCDMYKGKRFHLRPVEEILADLDEARGTYALIDRVFLADGDALVMKQDDLLAVLDHIGKIMPECERITSYASPKSIGTKRDEELKALREHGLDMVYMGLESGSDKVLARINKGATRAEILEAGRRIHAAGMRLSVTAISGLGGLEAWEEHADETASALSALKAEYIGLLTLSVRSGTPLYNWVENGSFQKLGIIEVFQETKRMLAGIDSEGSVFRANHASNVLPLGGTLNADRDAMIQELDKAIERFQRDARFWARQ